MWEKEETAATWKSTLLQDFHPKNNTPPPAECTASLPLVEIEGRWWVIISHLMEDNTSLGK
jgi:hypothetical protein